MHTDHVSLLAGIILIKLVSGMAMGLFGPMLPTLANNTHVDVASASWIFSIRSFAIFVGGNLPNLMLGSINMVVVLMLSGILQVAALFLIPIIHNLTVLLVAVFSIGCVIGMVDVGGQILILKFFKRDSPQLIQLFHFVFNVGAILGNTVVAAYIQPSKETPCFPVTDADSNVDSIDNSTVINNQPANMTKERMLAVGFGQNSFETSTEKESRGFITDDFSMAFHIPAYITIFPVVLLLILNGIKILERVVKVKKRQESRNESGNNENEPNEDEKEEEKEDFGRVRFFIILLTITLFTNTSTQQVVEAYIYEYSRCSADVSLTSEAAAAVVTILWVTATISRGTGIIISQITSPKKYIVFDYFLVLSALAMLVIRPLITHLYLIAAIIAFAFGIATLYANIIIYTVSVFNVENGYMWVFYIGAQLLPTFNPVICGKWMEYDKTGFIYFNGGMMLISAIVLPILFKTGDGLILEKQAQLEAKHMECTSIDSNQELKDPTNNPSTIAEITLRNKINIGNNSRATSRNGSIHNGSLHEGRSPRLPPQLQRLTEVERVVRVSTSVNSIAISVKSQTGTYTSGLTEDTMW